MLFILKKYFIYAYAMCVKVPKEAIKRALDPLEIELQVTVSYLIRVLGRIPWKNTDPLEEQQGLLIMSHLSSP